MKWILQLIQIELFYHCVTAQDSNWEFDITFDLYTRKNPTETYILKFDDEKNVMESPLHPGYPTKVIIHGWKSSAEAEWMKNIRNNYLTASWNNVILVDWHSIAAENYFSAAIKTPAVGKYVGQFLAYLRDQKGISFDRVHISGHSLGAHIAGYAGRYLSGQINRITGMDPANPLFGAMSTLKGLGRQDAVFVDIIHTCVGYTGIEGPVGDVDFYPNGGICQQPGCPADKAFECGHLRSREYMIESIINPAAFTAVECNSWDDYLKGFCERNSATLMGEYTSRRVRGKYFSETSDVMPYGKGIRKKYKSLRNRDNRSHRYCFLLKKQELNLIISLK